MEIGRGKVTETENMENVDNQEGFLKAVEEFCVLSYKFSANLTQFPKNQSVIRINEITWRNFLARCGTPESPCGLFSKQFLYTSIFVLNCLRHALDEETMHKINHDC